MNWYKKAQEMKMMPGQEPYSEEELNKLNSMISDAADGDPGEIGEDKFVYFDVYLLAFMDKSLSNVRNVSIPSNIFYGANDRESELELIFKYGQNDFQNKNLPSVSVGDVIKYSDNEYYDINMSGFKLLSRDEFEKLDGFRATNSYKS